MLRSVKYGLYGAVLAGLIAVPVAWSSVDKSVQLVVDGQPQTVQTTASTVGGVLRDAGYQVGGHDLVAPAVADHVSDGTRVVLRRGRLLLLNVNGRQTEVWTTAPTVADALSQLGYSTSDFVSVSRSRRLPLGRTDIAIRTPIPVTVVHDGTAQPVTTTAATVEQLLASLGVTVGPADRLSAPPSAALVAGETVRVQRVSSRLVTRVESLPYGVTQQDDAAIYQGTTQVVTTGRAGSVRATYSLLYVDGKLAGEVRLASVVLTAPQAQVEHVGTKPTPAPTQPSGGSTGGGGSSSAGVPAAAIPSPGSAQAIARGLLKSYGWGDDQFSCLVILWDHESGWRVDAANPSGAYGIPQALPGSKMASAGPDWQNNAETQIKWGLGYIAGRYSTPCGAWSTWQANGGWY